MRIEPGEIRVGEVLLVLDEEYVRVWHVDLDSKYAQAKVLSFSADEVLLHAADRTKRVDEARRGRPTVLKVDLPDGWLIMVDCARYTCRIVGYRPSGYTYAVSWSDEDGEYVARVEQFPSLSFLAADAGEALAGLRQIVADVEQDLADEAERGYDPDKLRARRVYHITEPHGPCVPGCILSAPHLRGCDTGVGGPDVGAG